MNEVFMNTNAIYYMLFAVILGGITVTRLQEVLVVIQFIVPLIMYGIFESTLVSALHMNQAVSYAYHSIPAFRNSNNMVQVIIFPLLILFNGSLDFILEKDYELTQGTD
jgi:hypothetical protein